MTNKRLFIIPILLVAISLLFSPLTLANEQPAEILTTQTVIEAAKSPLQIKHKKKIKVLSPKGSYRFRNLKFTFNQNRSKIEDLQAKIIRPDEENITLNYYPDSSPRPKPGIYDFTPQHLQFYNDLYPELKTKLLVFEPKLKPGDIISYSYTKTINQSVINGHFWFTNQLDQFYPTKNSQLKVKLPTEKNLNYQTTNLTTKPDIKHNPETTTYLWKATDIPALKQEPAMPPRANYSGRTIISTLDSWEQVSSWYQNLTEDKYSLSKAGKEKVEELTADLTTTKEKIKAIYNYVALNINHVPQHRWGSGNYEPHSAAKIFQTKAGDAHDQSTLLIALLKKIGIKAQPGLINTSYQPSYKVPTPELFNYVGVYLPEQNLYLTPTLSAVRYNQIPFIAQGKQMFLPHTNQFKQLPQSRTTDNHQTIQQKIKLTSSGKANINLQMSTDGYYSTANKINYRQQNPHRRIVILLNKTMQNVFGKHNMKQAEMKGVDGLKQPFRCQIGKLTVPNYAQLKGDKLTFRPFKFSITIPPQFNKFTNLIAKNKLFPADDRQYPVTLLPIQLKRSFDISLPQDFKVQQLPEDKTVTNKVGKLKVNYTQQEEKIIINFQLTIQQGTISHSDFELARNLFQKLVAVKEAEIKLEKK